MLSRPQIILLKRAQTQAGLDDAEYRDALETVSRLYGCRSSKDPRLTDRTLDQLLAYFEAIFWSKVDCGRLPEPDPFQDRPFRIRGFWAARNTKSSTSRDRFVLNQMQDKVQAAESSLLQLGFGCAYLAAIKDRIQPWSLAAYAAALNRTLKAKSKTLTTHEKTD